MCIGQTLQNNMCVNSNFSLDDWLCSYFDLCPIKDDEGFRHVFISTCGATNRETSNKLTAVDVPMEKWLSGDISNTLILSYNNDNELSLTWREQDITRFSIKSAKVRSLKCINEPCDELEFIIGELSNALLTVGLNPKVEVNLSII